VFVIRNAGDGVWEGVRKKKPGKGSEVRSINCVEGIRVLDAFLRRGIYESPREF
jgi:hypothetical protein